VKLTLVYFAWVRERIGKDEETLYLSLDRPTIAGVLAELMKRGPGYERALGQPEHLRFAVNQDFAPLDAEVPEAAELAIFPPVTGG
jgi:molybdopterin synthase sulfur carrier subunit